MCQVLLDEAFGLLIMFIAVHCYPPNSGGGGGGASPSAGAVAAEEAMIGSSSFKRSDTCEVSAWAFAPATPPSATPLKNEIGHRYSCRR